MCSHVCIKECVAPNLRALTLDRYCNSSGAQPRCSSCLMTMVWWSETLELNLPHNTHSHTTVHAYRHLGAFNYTTVSLMHTHTHLLHTGSHHHHHCWVPVSLYWPVCSSQRARGPPPPPPCLLSPSPLLSSYFSHFGKQIWKRQEKTWLLSGCAILIWPLLSVWTCY